MPDTAPIVQAIDFIEDHLQEPIGVADMAAAVSYSLYHFCRTFDHSTHHTPYDYLMRRRLAEAARALLETDDKIIDVALDYQFNNPETFSRAFKRVLGLQPSQWRRAGQPPDPRRLMPRLTAAHIEQVARGAHPRPEVLEMEAVELAGLMTTVQEDQTAILHLWDLLSRELSPPVDTAGTRVCYALSIYPEGGPDTGYLYLAAVEETAWDRGEAALRSSGLVGKTIPAITCAVVSHQGPGQDLTLALDYVYHTWLPSSGWRPAQPWIIERFRGYPWQTEDEQLEREIFIPVSQT